MTALEAFRRDGYCHFRGVFEPAQMAAIRAAVEGIVATPSDYPGDLDNDANFGTTRCDIYARFDELRWVLMHQPLIDALKQILGDPVVFIPEHALHKSFFARWHRDTDSPRHDRQTFYHDAAFNMVQVAIYLQDNAPETGGGLDVVPGSHLEVRPRQERLERWVRDMPLPFGRGRGLLHRLATHRLEKEKAARQPLTLPIRAGDVVAFNLKLRHRATPRTNGAATADKFGLFLVCSADNRIAHDYLRYIRDVRKYAYLARHKFDDEFARTARQAGAILL